MIPTPRQSYKRYGLGAVNYHTGETVVIFRQHKRRKEVAELLQALLEKNPHQRIYLAWDNSNIHEDYEVDAVVRAPVGNWFCYIYQLIPLGSTRSKCSGDIFGAK